MPNPKEIQGTKHYMPPVQVNKKVAITLIGLSFMTSILYSYLLSFTERGLPPLNWFNVTLNIIWLYVLLWVAWDIYRNKPRVKRVILFFASLSALSIGFDLFEEDGSLLLAGISSIEAFFFLQHIFY